jgi:Plasmid stabilization system protein
MKTVKYARRAISDLEDITDYTARTWGADQAKAYNKDVRAKISEIVSGKGSVLNFVYLSWPMRVSDTVTH